MTRSMIPTLPAAGLTGFHLHRGPDWRPYPLLPEGDAHDDGGSDGGDDDGDGADDGTGAEGADDGKGGDAELTVEQWREKFEAQQRVNRNLERRTRRDKATIDKLNATGKPADGEPVDADKIRETVRAEVTQEVLRERVLDKIEAKAGGKFSIDAADVAVMLLRRAEGGVDDFLADGKVDAQAITDALAELLKQSPTLAAQGGKSQRFQGGADGGPRGGQEKSVDEQIAEAQKAGNTRLALSLQNSKLLNLPQQ